MFLTLPDQQRTINLEAVCRVEFSGDGGGSIVFGRHPFDYDDTIDVPAPMSFSATDGLRLREAVGAPAPEPAHQFLEIASATMTGVPPAAAEQQPPAAHADVPEPAVMSPATAPEQHTASPAEEHEPAFTSPAVTSKQLDRSPGGRAPRREQRQLLAEQRQSQFVGLLEQGQVVNLANATRVEFFEDSGGPGGQIVFAEPPGSHEPGQRRLDPIRFAGDASTRAIRGAVNAPQLDC